MNFDNGKVNEYVKGVTISGFTLRGFKIPAIDLTGTRDATATKNRVLGSGPSS